MVLAALAITALGLAHSAQADSVICSSDEGVWVPMGTMGPYSSPDGDPLWTGDRVLFGQEGSDTGFSYDPQTDQTSTYSQLVPNSRQAYSKVWTGTRMIIWGGVDINTVANTGGVYDPVTDTWTPRHLRRRLPRRHRDRQPRGDRGVQRAG